MELDDWAGAVIRHAAALARALAAPLTLVHVVVAVRAQTRYAAALAAATDARKEEAAAKLASEAARLADDVAVRTDIRVGSPPEEIAAAASADAGRIIVIGLGGGRLLTRPGSTAYRVLALSSMPVLAVPTL